MSALRRHILPYVLSLLIALTGQAAAVAHAAPGPSGQMELCTGSGPVMVYVDDEGQPIGDPVYCPDFALSLILMLDLAEVLPHPVTISFAIGRDLAVDFSVVRAAVATQLARGPPSAI